MDFKVLGSNGPGFCLFSWWFFYASSHGIPHHSTTTLGIFVVILFQANLRLETEKHRPKPQIFGSSSCGTLCLGRWCTRSVLDSYPPWSFSSSQHQKKQCRSPKKGWSIRIFQASIFRCFLLLVAGRVCSIVILAPVWKENIGILILQIYYTWMGKRFLTWWTNLVVLEIHPGRLTAGTYKSPFFQRNMIFQTSMIYVPC